MSKGYVNAGIKLKLIREKQGFSLKVVASFLGVEKKLLASFETGKNTLSIDEIEKLATLFSLDFFTAQGGIDKIKTITLPLKASKISKEDLESIYAINKIALNSDFMTKLRKINAI